VYLYCTLFIYMCYYMDINCKGPIYFLSTGGSKQIDRFESDRHLSTTILDGRLRAPFPPRPPASTVSFVERRPRGPPSSCVRVPTWAPPPAPSSDHRHGVPLPPTRNGLHLGVGPPDRPPPSWRCVSLFFPPFHIYDYMSSWAQSMSACLLQWF
jgi:hypothetical protein